MQVRVATWTVRLGTISYEMTNVMFCPLMMSLIENHKELQVWHETINQSH